VDKVKYAWHFSNGYLAYDRTSEEIRAGLSLACNPDKIELCQMGFHSSYRLLDALGYAQGSTLSYCEIGGRISEDDDKNVSSIRRHLAVADITRTLHEFAIWCAEQALALVDNPDERGLEALRVKRLWLDGKATDEELDVARAAAWDVARVAAWAAARGAAWDVAWDAARAADMAAGTAWDAAWDAEKTVTFLLR